MKKKTEDNEKMAPEQAPVETQYPESLQTYTALLMDYNTRVNLVSRKITPEGLTQLLNETLLLNSHITHSTVIDAGSGNGLLGIPVAILNPARTVILVEPTQKKAAFLSFVTQEMKLSNVRVIPGNIEEYLFHHHKINHHDNSRMSLITRGFPHLDILCSYLKRRLFHELLTLTATNKIESLKPMLENIQQKIYNVPLRTELKLLKLLPMEKNLSGIKKQM